MAMPQSPCTRSVTDRSISSSGALVMVKNVNGLSTVMRLFPVIVTASSAVEVIAVRRNSVAGYMALMLAASRVSSIS